MLSPLSCSVFLSLFPLVVFPEECFHSRIELSPGVAVPGHRQAAAGPGWAAELDPSCTCSSSPACQAVFVPSSLSSGQPRGVKVRICLAGVWLGDKDSAGLGDEEPLSR